MPDDPINHRKKTSPNNRTGTAQLLNHKEPVARTGMKNFLVNIFGKKESARTGSKGGRDSRSYNLSS